MKQFVISEPIDAACTLVLTGKDFHYLCRVRRFSEGDRFTCIDTHAKRFTATVLTVGEDSCEIQLTPKQEQATRTDKPRITVYQCLPKGKIFDGIIRRLTEMGVHEFIPLVSEFAVPRLDTKEITGKMKRWSRIIREAVQQSGVAHLPRLHPPQNILSLGVAGLHELSLLFHQEPLADLSLHEYLVNQPSSIDIIIGPEGGLSEHEIQFLREQGCKPAYLGPQILKVETAAVVATAAIQVIVRERNNWKPAITGT